MDKRKLNLKWVTETIGEDYKNWRKGDIVSIQAQTGTGKTFLITGSNKVKGMVDRLDSYQRLMYICNRIELKRQVKLDLLKKFNEEIPLLEDGELDIEKLDEIVKIKNVIVTSYHCIASALLDNTYKNGNYNLDNFDYIVCDEAHFILTDGSFYSCCSVIFDELIKNTHRNSIKIFISATMDELIDPINKAIEDIRNISFGTYKNIKLHDYTTGIDYSYLNIKYFSYLKDIISTIKNDKSDDKWIVFVTSENNGLNIKKELQDSNITCDFIKAGSKSEQSKNITANCKFECKVLITTKVLDNGVNIKDSEVKNIVVMAYDKTTFIQEIGRIRFRIDDAPTINLYIRTCYKKTFESLIKKTYEPKFAMIKEYREDIALFNKKYDRKLNELYGDLFYRDEKTGKIKINKVGHARLIKDNSFAEKIVEKFKNNGKFAFITEQLEWLQLQNTFDEELLIEDVVDENEIDRLEDYLDKLIDKKLFSEEQQELSNMIIKQLITVGNQIDYRTKKIKPSTLEKILRDDLNLDYSISKSEKESSGINRGKRYIVITK